MVCSSGKTGLWSLALLVALGAAGSARGAAEWVRQFGSTKKQTGSSAVSADALGNVYISGWTSGSVGGPNAGDLDAFVSKYTAAGVLQWTRQFGGTDADSSSSISTDGLGNVYVAGGTRSDLGGPSTGYYDAFVSKFNTAGTLQWSRKLSSANYDGATGVSADGLGSVYVAGYSLYESLTDPNAGGDDGFVSKYDAAGGLLWIRQLVTSGVEWTRGLSSDSLGNIFVSGITSDHLHGPNVGRLDGFVSKLNAAGTIQWTREFGSTGDVDPSGVSADGLGNVYITGTTSTDIGGLNSGDAFVSKYDAAGNLLWIRQFGTAGGDSGGGIWVDSVGNAYVTGSTQGNLGGPSAGEYDPFLCKYDASGNLLWIQQIGSTTLDGSSGVSADGQGNIFITGTTYGSFGGPLVGFQDGFLAKFSSVPEPSPIAISLIAAAVFGFAAKRKRFSTSFTS